MGNRMMCVTTSRMVVAQGRADHCKSGAPLPPPPTGAGGGGSAAHLHVLVVAQVAFELVPMPLFLSAEGTVGGGYAFALWTLTAKVRLQYRTNDGAYNCSSGTDNNGNQCCFLSKILYPLCGTPIQFHFCNKCGVTPFSCRNDGVTALIPGLRSYLKVLKMLFYPEHFLPKKGDRLCCKLFVKFFHSANLYGSKILKYNKNLVGLLVIGHHSFFPFGSNIWQCWKLT